MPTLILSWCCFCANAILVLMLFLCWCGSCADVVDVLTLLLCQHCSCWCFSCADVALQLILILCWCCSCVNEIVPSLILYAGCFSWHCCYRYSHFLKVAFCQKNLDNFFTSQKIFRFSVLNLFIQYTTLIICQLSKNLPLQVSFMYRFKK